MGFWGKVGKVSFKTAKVVGSAVTVVANAIEKKAGEINDLKEEYDFKSDEELKSIIRSSGFSEKSDTEKGVARRVLRERGYASSQDS